MLQKIKDQEKKIKNFITKNVSFIEIFRFIFCLSLFAVAGFLIFLWFGDIAVKVTVIAAILIYANNNHIFQVLRIFDKEFEEKWKDKL